MLVHDQFLLVLYSQMLLKLELRFPPEEAAQSIDGALVHLAKYHERSIIIRFFGQKFVQEVQLIRTEKE